MKNLKYIFIAIISLLISCSSLKNGSGTLLIKAPEKSKTDINLTTDNSQRKVDSIAPVPPTKFDLSFLENPGNKSYIDSLGNLIINDAVLGKRIRNFLKLQPNALITISAVDSVIKLDLNNHDNKTPDNQKISNIDALAYFKNLKILRINNNLVRNISPIENLNNLIELDLSLNRITNISVIKNLVKLNDLNLYGNGVSDISSLSNLKGLQKLNLWANGIFKIDSLKDLFELTNLNLGGNYIRDISPLRKMGNLRTLWLVKNLIQNPEIISECGANLTSLSIAKCGISDIRFLVNCTQLTELLIFDNQIEDVSVLEKMVNLNSFLAANNQISNIDVLPVLVKNGAFKVKGKFAENINIDLSNNKIDYQRPTNQKIKKYLIENVYKVKL